MEVFLIGRDLSHPIFPDATPVEIAHPQVSSQHLSVEVRDDDVLFVHDLGSTNGTRVNLEKTPLVPREPREVTWDDILYLGSFRFPLRRLQEEYLQTTLTVTDDSGQFAAFVVQSNALLDSTKQADKPARLARAAVPKTISLDPSELPLPSSTRVLPSVRGMERKLDTGKKATTHSQQKKIERIHHTISLDIDSFQEKHSIQTLTIGRAEDNDIALPFPSISAHHACLYRSPEKLVIADLGSTNGTFVDGRRIKRPTPLTPGQRVLLANHPLLVRDDLQVEIQGVQKLRVDVEGLNIFRGKHQLLDDISVSLYPYEIVAIMGPSGCGKSTLLKSMTGIYKPDQGEIRYNGFQLAQHYDRFRGTIGYVPQDDLLYNELTVFQSVMYTGRIRLPLDWTLDMIRDRCEEILRQLGLWEHKEKSVHQLSGGQRKRLVLAQELLTDPPLLFLDEPTSGLSARDSFRVVEILRALADEGKSIVLVIHQPSARIFEMMDQLLLLASGGKLAYFGPTSQSYDYFKTEENPDELLFCLEEDEREPDDWKKQYLEDDLYRHYVTDRAQTPISLSSPKVSTKGQWALAFRQWRLLSQRYLLIKSKDTVNTALLLVQAPIIAGLLCLLLIKTNGRLIASHIFDQADHITPMFVLGLAALWLGCANSAREIVSERVIFLRERMINLKLPSYLLSKFTVLLLLCSIQCILLLGICYPLLGFTGDFWTQWTLLVLTACSGLGLGLCISSFVNTPASAASILPLILLPQIIFGGYIVPTPKTDNPIVRAASYLTITRWSFASLLQSEYTGMSAKMKYKRIKMKELQRDGIFQVACMPDHCLSNTPNKCKPMKELLWFRDAFEEFGFSSPTPKAPAWKRPLLQNGGLLIGWTVLFLLLTLISLRRL